MKLYLLMILTFCNISLIAMNSDIESDDELKREIALLNQNRESTSIKDKTIDHNPVEKIFKYLNSLYEYDKNQLRSKNEIDIAALRKRIYTEIWQDLPPDQKALPILIPISLIMEICYGEQRMYIEKADTEEVRDAIKIHNVDIEGMLAKYKEQIKNWRKLHNKLATEKTKLEQRLAEIDRESKKAMEDEKYSQSQIITLSGLRDLMKDSTLKVKNELEQKIKDFKNDIQLLTQKIENNPNQETKDQLNHEKHTLEIKLEEAQKDFEKISDRLASKHDSRKGMAEQFLDINSQTHRSRFLTGWYTFWNTKTQ